MKDKVENSYEKKVSILVVEDNYHVRDIIKDLFQLCYEYECELFFADNVNTALKKIERENIDILLTDLNLGDEHPMGGLEIIDNIEKKNKKIKIIVLSGNRDKSTRSRFMRISKDIVGFIEKPICYDEFDENVKKAIEMVQRE